MKQVSTVVINQVTGRLGLEVNSSIPDAMWGLVYAKATDPSRIKYDVYAEIWRVTNSR